jgi:acetylornithine deacetylase
LRETGLDLDALDAAIEERTERAFGFLERLVAAPSTIGIEQEAQAEVERELARLGFEVASIAIPSDIGEDPFAGVPQATYDGRYDIVGRMGAGEGPSLLINGHVDVVPADQPELWDSPPFTPRRDGGRMYGRGTGDMKGGFAMAALAIDALLATAADSIAGSLTFVSAIEEECTGNGTLAAARAGVLADAVLLAEPTGLDLLLAGVGVLWLDVVVSGLSAHAESADRAVNPVHLAFLVIDAIRELEREMNLEVDDPAMYGIPHPYNLNVGALSAGDWPSSVPAQATLRVRVGHPTAWTAEQAEQRVRDAVGAVADADPWLRDHPPVIRASGFRAQGYALAADHPLVARVSAAHRAAHGVAPDTFSMASTTDARLYLNAFDVPALCYGPASHDIHGINENVELASIVDGARTLARFIADWYASPPGWEGTRP